MTNEINTISFQIILRREDLEPMILLILIYSTHTQMGDMQKAYETIEYYWYSTLTLRGRESDSQRAGSRDSHNPLLA